jgi:hypothetical protein
MKRSRKKEKGTLIHGSTLICQSVNVTSLNEVTSNKDVSVTDVNRVLAVARLAAVPRRKLPGPPPKKRFVSFASPGLAGRAQASEQIRTACAGAGPAHGLKSCAALGLMGPRRPPLPPRPRAGPASGRRVASLRIISKSSSSCSRPPPSSTCCASRRHARWRSASCTTSPRASTPTSCATFEACPNALHRALELFP